MFWDLYCAAPDRRETCEHSSEAKAFHDYVSAQPLVLFLRRWAELSLEGAVVQLTLRVKGRERTSGMDF